MPGLRPLCAMGFIASIGLTCLALACTGKEGNFWPLIIFVSYLLIPIPFILTRRIVKDTMVGMDDASIKRTRDYGLFFTAGIIVSTFALPLIMARTPINKPTITPGKCFFVELANFLFFMTIGLFCMYFKPLKA